MDQEKHEDDLTLETSDPTLDRLRERQRQLRERLKQLEARESKKQRALDTRRKILGGAAVMAAVENGDLPKSKWRYILDKYLTIDRDRVVFGLPLRNPPEPVPSSLEASQVQSEPTSNSPTPSESSAPRSRRSRPALTPSSDEGGSHASS